MKTIIEKFIEITFEAASEIEDQRVRAQIESLASRFEAMEKHASIEELARPVLKHLCERTDLYHPHHTVILTGTSCELLEGVKSCGKIMDYVID